MKTLKKLQQARQKIKEEPLKKLGKNAYSNYDYFTPEQISTMVAKVNQEFNLFTKFDLVRTELGLMATLHIYDLESEDSVKFEIATEIPEIKATNVAQQLGGCVTYSERYLLQIAYDIKDNNLDFETKQPNEKKKQELTPSHKAWQNAIEYLKKPDSTMDVVLQKFNISQENIQKLQEAAI